MDDRDGSRRGRPMSDLAADHRTCAAALRGSGSSFAGPIRLLPPAKRRGTTALYAFCRRADDLVDGATDPACARVALDAFEREVVRGLDGEPVGDPVVRALADTTRRFAIPRAAITDILAGVRMDLDRHRYATWTDLEEYCRRVATAVGIASIHVWGFRDPAAVEAAHDCGLAFQFTNILRDIPEDLARGRVYLPEEEFHACGCAVDDLLAGRIGPEFATLAARACGRTADRYAGAARLDRMLSTDGRLAFRAMFGVYRRLFDAVRRGGTRIFTARVRPSRAALLTAAAATALLGPGRPSRRWVA
ncbi:MAG: phytoene/squalene synthase family protein [Planctomycetia bacterium]